MTVKQAALLRPPGAVRSTAGMGDGKNKAHPPGAVSGREWRVDPPGAVRSTAGMGGGENREDPPGAEAGVGGLMIKKKERRKIDKTDASSDTPIRTNHQLS